MKSTKKQLNPFDPAADIYYVIDIETTTDHNKIRCVGFTTHLGSKHSTKIVTDSEVLKGILSAVNASGHTLVTWNGERFDWPVLERLWGVYRYDYPDIRHIDGMIAAKILHPGEPSYSLDAFSKKFSPEYTKHEVPDVSWYDTCSKHELHKYLEADLKATYNVVKNMYTSATYLPKVTQRAIGLETEVARLCQLQRDKGVRFNKKKAADLVGDLREETRLIEKNMEDWLPYRPLPKSKIKHPPKVQFKKNGEPHANLLRYLDQHGWMFSSITRRATNGAESRPLPLREPLVTKAKITLSNQAELKIWLMEEGWEPLYWNTKRDPETGKYKRTSPRFTDKGSSEICENLQAMDLHYTDDIVRWLMLRSRKNVIQSDNGTGWIHAAKEECEYWTLPSDADTNGAGTGRWTHKVIANVPRVSSPYGRDMRELFCARPDKVWVGWDASSLEARCEAHYLYPIDPEAAIELCTGDIHTKNLKAIEPLRDREHAKTLKYGTMYGAQAKKVASILGVGESEGEYWFEAFWKANPALAEFRRQCILEAESGYITAIDGRRIAARSPHSALNFKLQSCGAIVMKYAMVIANKRIKEKFHDEAHGLIRYHDEEIWECDDPVIAEEVGKLGVESIALAGTYLGLNVPLGAEYKVGLNWAEVH